MRLRSAFIVASVIAASAASAQGVSGLYDGANTLVGEYIEFRNGTIVHTAKGFRFSIEGTTAQVGQIDLDVAGVSYGTNVLVYANFSCAGTPYVTASENGGAGGLVFSAGTRGLHQVGKTPTATVLLIGSSWNGSACTSGAGAQFLVVPASVNVPAVTGVPAATFVPPLRLEVVPLSQFFGLFKDGFESSLRENSAIHFRGHA